MPHLACGHGFPLHYYRWSDFGPSASFDPFSLLADFLFGTAAVAVAAWMEGKIGRTRTNPNALEE